MKRKPVINIALCTLLALSLTACGEKSTTEVTSVPTTKMNALLEKTDLSQVDITPDNEGFPLPTDQNFIGTWSASSPDATAFYSIVIGTDMSNEEAPYVITINGYEGEQMDTSYNWKLNAKADPANPNLLVYSGATKFTYLPMTEEEAEKLSQLSEAELEELPEKEPDYKDGSGSFLIQEDTLVWTDNKDKTAWDLFFTKVDENGTAASEAPSTEPAAPASTEAGSANDKPPITNNNGNRLIEDDEIIQEKDAVWDYDESDYPDWDEEETEDIEGDLDTEDSSTETETE